MQSLAQALALGARFTAGAMSREEEEEAFGGKLYHEVSEKAAVEAARKGVGGCGKEEERGGEKIYSQ